MTQEQVAVTAEKIRAGKTSLGIEFGSTRIKAVLIDDAYHTIAAGDSFNGLAMIRASRAGFLFRSTPQIQADNPDLPAFTEYADLLAAITEAL